MQNYPGKFIVFEGGEGTGKTTQIKLLEKKLQENGFHVFLTREPGGTNVPLAEKIRIMLKDPENKNMCPETELFLFLASRAQHVQRGIVPHLERGDVVISDRFFGSTLAYQHFGRGLFNIEEVKKINDFATGGLSPALTLLLDIPPEKGLERIKENIHKDRLDSEALPFHQKVRQGYLTLAKTRSNWAVIPADNTIETVFNQIWDKVRETVNLN
ncbi:dTMP kinase [Candidatus Kuenenbacteria bacterium]|nr:dTMP kinase [Candidatus Kuenenbacteria bacterium]